MARAEAAVSHVEGVPELIHGLSRAATSGTLALAVRSTDRSLSVSESADIVTLSRSARHVRDFLQDVDESRGRPHLTTGKRRQNGFRSGVSQTLIGQPPDRSSPARTSCTRSMSDAPRGPL